MSSTLEAIDKKSSEEKISSYKLMGANPDKEFRNMPFGLKNAATCC